VAFKTLDC